MGSETVTTLRTKYVAMLLMEGEVQLAEIASGLSDQDLLFTVICEPGGIAGYLNWVNAQGHDLDEAITEIATAIDTTIRNNQIEPEHAQPLLAAMVGAFAVFTTFGLSGT